MKIDKTPPYLVNEAKAQLADFFKNNPRLPPLGIDATRTRALRKWFEYALQVPYKNTWRENLGDDFHFEFVWEERDGFREYVASHRCTLSTYAPGKVKDFDLNFSPRWVNFKLSWRGMCKGFQFRIR